MTTEHKTSADELMSRHARTFVPCPMCWDKFERQRQEAGIGNPASVYCEHNGVRVGWNAASITLDLCASSAERERIDAGYKASLGRVGAHTTQAEVPAQ